MLWWNFRVIRTRVNGQNVLSLHRVFYNSEQKKQPVYVENLPASISGVLPLSMMEDIEAMTEAWHRPTIYIPEWNSGQ